VASEDHPKRESVVDKLSSFLAGGRLADLRIHATKNRALGHWIAERVGTTGAVAGIDPLEGRIHLGRPCGAARTPPQPPARFASRSSTAERAAPAPR
jgi:hypothetical protein